MTVRLLLAAGLIAGATTPSLVFAQNTAVAADLKVAKGLGADSVSGRPWWGVLGNCSTWYLNVRGKRGATVDKERGNMFGRLAVERVAKDRGIPGYVAAPIVLRYVDAFVGISDTENFYNLMLVTASTDGDESKAVPYFDEACGDFLKGYQRIAG